MKIPFGALAIGLASSLVAHQAAAQSKLAKPTIDTVNRHIVRVMNSGPTAWTDTNGWKLVLERTVQPADGHRGMLENPEDVLLLDDGRLVVVEGTHPALNLFDAHGAFVRALGRLGEGPGEYRSIEAAPLGDTVVIQDQRLKRLTLMRLDGTFLRSFPSVCCAGGAGVSVSPARIRVTSGSGEWHYFNLDGRSLDSLRPPQAAKPKRWEYATNGGHGSVGIPLGGWTAYATIPNGRLVYGATDQSEFVISTTGRDTVRMFGISNDVAPPAPGSLRDSLFRLVTAQPEVKAVARLGDVPSTYPMWDFIWADRAANIWLLRGGRYGPVRRFDVFSQDGRWLGPVATPFTSIRAASFTRDRAAILDTDANDLPRIRIFRIDRRGH